jgi:hypothetical protein
MLSLGLSIPTAGVRRGGAPAIPANAIKDRADNAISDRAGTIIETRA